MRPPIVYFGGKIRMAGRLTELMPGHDHYVEPYCGSLAVLLAKRPAAHETVNDLDQDLMTFWRVLRDQPDELERACALTPHSRAEHAAAYTVGDAAAVDDVERARRVWVHLTQGRAGLRSKTGWRHYQDPSRSTQSMPGYLAGYVARIHPAAERLARVSLECRPALDVIADYGRHDGVLLYVDPPYLASARSSGAYLREMGTPGEHTALLAAVRACRAAVVLSGYPSDLYDDALTGWDRVEIHTATGQGGTWQDRTEVVWCNRPLAEQQRLDLDEVTV
jgi:DNA adenine methylase